MSEDNSIKVVEVKPTLCLFGLDYTYRNTIDYRDQFIVYLVWKGCDSSSTLDYHTVSSALATLDWYTFNWTLVPKSIFKNIFSTLAHHRLVYFLGYFHCWDDETNERNNPQMIDALWSYFSKQNK